MDHEDTSGIAMSDLTDEQLDERIRQVERLIAHLGAYPGAMTDDEVTIARERAVVVLSGVEGPCSQAGPHLQLARDVLVLTDALRFANGLLDESTASE